MQPVRQTELRQNLIADKEITDQDQYQRRHIAEQVDIPAAEHPVKEVQTDAQQTGGQIISASDLSTLADLLPNRENRRQIEEAEPAHERRRSMDFFERIDFELTTNTVVAGSRRAVTSNR